MKIIEKYEVEHVIPENEAERAEIKKLIAKFENPHRKIDLTKATIIDNSEENNGLWLRK